MTDENIYYYDHSDQIKYDLQFGCTFCAQFDEMNNSGVCEAIFGEQFNRILYEDKDFVVVPALGHLVEGYVLIISRRHFESFAKLPLNLQRPLLKLKDKLSKIILEEYQVLPLFFEHGPICDHQKGGACINHAHLHVVPININFINNIPKMLNITKVDSISALWNKNFSINYPYLFFECGENEIYLVEVNEYVPSQYFRRVIAERVGIPDQWDWKQYIAKEKVVKTVAKLKGRIH